MASAPSAGVGAGSDVPLLRARLLEWYAGSARDLPWRRPGTSPWAILVSEVMLQQTPVARVLPVYTEWIPRWPTPAALAAQPPATVIRAWGRLGYPRRALRLHEAARVLVAAHEGEVPRGLDQLRALPGVGAYTAAAVASFAYGQRHAVLDTNVRRVLARVFEGVSAAAPAPTVGELRRAEALVPADDSAPRWAIALMELGALVCTARAPHCERCPILDACAWARAGRPAYASRSRRAQGFAGTDRQVRGLLLDRLRTSPGPVPSAELAGAWADEDQRNRALAALLADGLAERYGAGSYRLPVSDPAGCDTGS